MNFVIVDVETTGGSPKSSKITEIAMYKYDGIQIIDEYTSLVNPEIEIPEFIVRLTGITNDLVKNAPKFYEIAKTVIEFCEETTFVAHNVSFDYGMFRSEFKTLGYDFRKPHLCTVQAARQIIPGHDSYSLGKLSRSIGIEIKNRHRAGGDAFATTKLFDLLYQKNKNKLHSFIKEELNPKAIHPNLDMDTIDELPNKIGIYLFYNEFNQIIYIGKSISIKNRVLQHLRNKNSSKGIRMGEEITRVEHRLTGSELIALLLESELIKNHQPKFNRKLRKSRFPYGLFDNENRDGYLELTIQSIEKMEANPLLHFTSKKDGVDYLMNLGVKNKLCQKLCGLYDSHSSCFQYELKECNGACIGKESSKNYNERIQKFIDGLMYDYSSFLVLEKGRNRNEKSIILVENGIYKGYGYVPYPIIKQDTSRWLPYIESFKEDRDNRSIINGFLRKNEKYKRIELDQE
ncbi:MAG: exonuclease domain-containing protein [Crocinitomicaceae bacterium]